LSGYQKAINYHKYEDRVKFILEKIEELKKEKFESPNFTKLKIELKIKNIFWIIIKIFRRIKWKIQELA